MNFIPPTTPKNNSILLLQKQKFRPLTTAAAWSHYPSGDRIFGDSSSLYNNLRLNASSNGLDSITSAAAAALPFQNGHFFATSHHHATNGSGHNHHHHHNLNHMHHPASSTQMAAIFPDSTSPHLHALQPHPDQILSYHYHNHPNNIFR